MAIGQLGVQGTFRMGKSLVVTVGLVFNFGPFAQLPLLAYPNP